MPIPGRHTLLTVAVFAAFALLALGVLEVGFGVSRALAPARAPALAGLATSGGSARVRSRNGAPFEGGNIGAVRRTSPTTFELSLRSDNDDALPNFWRNWFYARLDDLPTNDAVKITLKGAGQWNYYLPFYSYDQKRWQQFDAKDVRKPSKLTVEITKRFTAPVVYVARYVPYTVSDLTAFLKRIEKHPDVVVGTLGRTPEGREIPYVTITTDRVASRKKSRILIHARTHPGEVGSSFLLEGLVNELLAKTSRARALRDGLIFDIVPMLNVDGVARGNNRVTPRGVNLEGKWFAREGAPLDLDAAKTPPEVQLLHARVKALLSAGTPITMALNLHASGGEPDDDVFFFPHFGPTTKGYAPVEASLYGRQTAFIRQWMDVQGAKWFNAPTQDGGKTFARRNLPESWWWNNFQDRVMALTVESAYGYAGPLKRWIKPDDMRALGRSLAVAIGRYHGLVGGKAGNPDGAALTRTVGKGPAKAQTVGH